MKKFTNKFAKFFSLALAVIMVFSFSFVVSADTAADASGSFDAIDWVYTAADKTITVTAKADGNHDVQYNTATEWVDLDYDKIVIEEGITKLISHALTGNKAKVIILPNSLRIIEEGAFKSATNLEWLLIPEGVTTLGASIVQGCSSLKSIYLPSTLVAANVNNSWCYDKNSSSKIELEKLYMFPNIELTSYADLKTKTYNKYIGKISKINAANIKADGTVAYATSANFETLLTSAVAGDTIVVLTDITSTGLPAYADGVKIVTNGLLGKSGSKDNVSWVYSAVKRTITLTGKNGQTVVPGEIGKKANSNGSDFDWETLDYNKIIISEGITELAERALQLLRKMEYVELPSTLTKVGNNAFNYCSGLKHLHIPVGTVNLRSNIINGCTSLKSLYLPLTLDSTQISGSWCNDNSGNVVTGSSMVLYMASEIESATALKNVTYNKYYGKVTITKTSTALFKADGTISYGTFKAMVSGAAAGDTVKVLSNVSGLNADSSNVSYMPASIAAGATIKYENGVTLKGAFTNTSWTYYPDSKTISLTDSDGVVGGTKPVNSDGTGHTRFESAFWKVLDYKKLVVGEGVTTLYKMSLMGIKAEEVVLPTTLKEIGENAFRDAKLKSIHIPEGVTTLGTGILQGCKAIQSVYLPTTLVAANVSNSWNYDKVNNTNSKIAIPALYMSETITYKDASGNWVNGDLKAKTYDKYFNDGVISLISGAYEVNGKISYNALGTVIANAADNATIKFMANTSASAFVTSNVTFDAGNYNYGNIFVADANGDEEINILDFITLIKKVDDTEGTVEINTAGLKFKADFAATNMVNLKKHLLGVAV